MFNTPLNVTHRVAAPKPKATPKEKPAPTAQSLNITYERIVNTKIDISGYKSYFFLFIQLGDVGDKEMSQIIISQPTMDQAIAAFERYFLRGDYYENAKLSVECIGIDIKPERTSPIVVAY